jgi:hypothetical protein
MQVITRQMRIAAAPIIDCHNQAANDRFCNRSFLFRRNLPQKFPKPPITDDRWHILQHCADIAAAH